MTDADFQAEFDAMSGEQKQMLHLIRLVEAAMTIIVPVMVTAVAEGRTESVIKGAEAAAQTWTNLAESIQKVKGA